MSRHQRRRETLSRERHEGHEAFDRLWLRSRNRRWTRRLAYLWLAHSLGVPSRMAHFGRMKGGLLARAIRVCRAADAVDVLAWWKRRKSQGRWGGRRLHPRHHRPRTSKTYNEARPARS